MIRHNKDNKIHWDEQGNHTSLLNVAGLIMNKSFETKEKLAHLPPSLPPLVLGPVTGSISLFHTQVGTSLPANGDISRRWEKQLLSKFPGMVSGTHPPLFYNALHLQKVLLWDKWGLCKTMTSQKNPTMGFKALSRLDSLKCPGSEGTHKETVEHRDSRGMYSNLYKNTQKQRVSFLVFVTVWLLKIHSQGNRQKNKLFFCQGIINIT